METSSGLLTAKQASEYVGLSASTLAKMRMIGSGPSYHKLGRRVVYNISDIDAWLARRRIATEHSEAVAEPEGV